MPFNLLCFMCIASLCAFQVYVHWIIMHAFLKTGKLGAVGAGPSTSAAGKEKAGGRKAPAPWVEK